MVSFAVMMTSKGWINANTGGGHKAALNKILGTLPDDTDVRQIDVKKQILQYNNLHPGELSPASLKQYEKRVAAMIGYYKTWKEDPTNFKPPQRELSDKTDKTSSSASNGRKVIRRTQLAKSPGEITVEPPKSNGTEAASVRRMQAETGYFNLTSGDATAMTPSLTMPFPLRDDYLASITIPRDMTKDEADRLCTFIQALARA